MNARIRELSEQAKPLDENGQKVLGLNSEYHDLWMENFAVLVVQECANAIDSDDRLNDVRSAARGCIRIIKEHFGVEE